VKDYYLDCAAHVPMSLSAQKAYIDYQNSEISSSHPSSSNIIGKKVSSIVENARSEIAQLLGAEKASQIIFTNTCTEACNWAVEILFNKSQNNLVEYSPFEHPAIKYLTETKSHIKKINIQNGIVNEFDGEFNICMHVQNEVGLIQPIEKFNGYLLSDMSQSLGKIKIDLSNVDLAVFSGHKIGAGNIGILYIKNIKDWISFGYGSRYYQDRVGTIDVGLILAFLAGLKDCINKMPEKIAKMKEFQESLENKLKDTIEVIYRCEERVPSITMVHIPKIAHFILNELSEKLNIHCSSGAACSSKLTTINSTMQILGIEAGNNDTLRISSSGDYGSNDGIYVAEQIIKLTQHYKGKIK
jgi:cysteine desulfurase